MNKNNNLGRFILVLVIIAWAFIEIYPPTSGDLIQAFATRSQNRDATFTNILERAASLQKAGTNNEFLALQFATGTNELKKYFPFIGGVDQQLQPNTYILNRLQRDIAGQIKLGIDLQGGTEFLVEVDTSKLGEIETRTNSAGQIETTTNYPDMSGALAQAIGVLRKRIDRFGVAEPIIQSAGGNRILIQLPGLSESDKAAAVEQIKKKAYLEFRIVHDNSAEILHNNDPIPPGYEILKQQIQMKGGQTTVEPYVVRKKPENNLAGDIIESAHVFRDNMGNPQIAFTLTDDAALRFGQTTKDNLHKKLAVVLDGELQTAPEIQSEIDKSGEITGTYTPEEAQNIANVLQNPLRAPLKVVFSSDVGATLGQDAIHSGEWAAIWGVAFVSLFMLLYYRLAGIAANVALITNVIILLGVMCSIGTTFTMPGIAGGVLTVGMAVDANVLIYERIREELAKGKSLRGAIDAGYARAFGTIFDSHVTTLISSIILIMMGTGEIKGFGVTLTIGVAASLFTALVVTRLIFNFLVDRNLIKTLSMAHIIRSANINFMKVATPFAVVTTVFAIGSIIFGGAVQGKKLFGIDFLGGDNVLYSYAQKVDTKDIRAVLAPLGENDAQIQYQKSGAFAMLSITSSSGSATNVQAHLAASFPQAQYKVVGGQQVGATLGSDILRSAVIACLVAMFGILVYVAFRYEFSFAVAAVAAVFHDVLFAIGSYCLASYFFERQFNATVVAALLTIIGFSINDKIVIFDRIRENLKLGRRGTFNEVINVALNQTLSRTIITSGTVFIATLCLFIWGGGVINDFALTFLVGIIVGTYSSIYIASVIVLHWHKGERPAIGASQMTVQSAPQAARPARV
jgi:SecD/SecF fusion protein